MSANGHKQIRVTVNGKAYVVELSAPAAGLQTVWVNGKAYQVTVETAADQPGAAVAAPAVRMAIPMTVAPHAATPAAPAPPAATVLGSQHVRAPMPGNILDVAVKPGDRVELGQTLCALEAMKMKSAIRAPRAGVIAAVHVRDGQAVAHGDRLISFE